MADNDLMVDGKPLSSLRVVDLKQELEKRGMSKSGTKKDLADRLKTVSDSYQHPAFFDASFIPAFLVKLLHKSSLSFTLMCSMI